MVEFDVAVVRRKVAILGCGKVEFRKALTWGGTTELRPGVVRFDVARLKWHVGVTAREILRFCRVWVLGQGMVDQLVAQAQARTGVALRDMAAFGELQLRGKINMIWRNIVACGFAWLPGRNQVRERGHLGF